MRLELVRAALCVGWLRACAAATDPDVTIGHEYGVGTDSAARGRAYNLVHNSPNHNPVSKLRPYLGLQKLVTPDFVSDDGRISKHHFEIKGPKGGRLRLKYQVEHHNAPLLALDKHECVKQVECTADSVTVSVCNASFAAHVAKDLAHTGMLAGGREWGCLGDEGLPKVILRKVVGVPAITAGDATKVVMRTSKAKYHDFFKSSNISFETNLWEEAAHVKQTNYVDDSNLAEKGRRRQLKWSGLWNVATSAGHALESTWTDIKHLGGEVKDLATSVYHAAKRTVQVVAGAAQLIATGSLHKQDAKTLASFSWNYNGGHTQQDEISLGSGVTCKNCYAHFQSRAVFELDISSYVVQNIAVYVDANAKYNIEGHLDWSGSYHKSGKKTITTINVPSVKFFVGPIPFYFHINIPVQVGYKVNMNAALHSTMSSSAEGQAKFGFYGSCGSRSVSSCIVHKISQHSYAHRGDLGSLDGTASAALTVFIMPTFVVDMDHLGGPTAGLKSSLQLLASHDSTRDSYCAKNFPDSIAQVSANFQFEATIGGHIDLHIGSASLWKKDFEPAGIYNHKWPIGTGCLGHSSAMGLGVPKASSGSFVASSPVVSGSGRGAARALVQSDGFVPGTVWLGTQSKLTRMDGKRNPICSQFPDSSSVTLQLQEQHSFGSSNIRALKLIGSQNFGKDTKGSAYACIVQVTYDLVIVKNGAILRLQTPGAFGASPGAHRKLFGVEGTTTPRSMASPVYRHCTNGPPKHPYGWAGFYDASKGELVLTDDQNCTQVTLTNRAQSASSRNAPPPPPPAVDPALTNPSDSFVSCVQATYINNCCQGSCAGSGYKGCFTCPHTKTQDSTNYGGPTCFSSSKVAQCLHADKSPAGYTKVTGKTIDGTADVFSGGNGYSLSACEAKCSADSRCNSAVSDGSSYCELWAYTRSNAPLVSSSGYNHNTDIFFKSTGGGSSSVSSGCALRACTVGQSVVRGKDWTWGNQDGGAGNKGVITSCDSGGDANVRWANGNSNTYYTDAARSDLNKASCSAGGVPTAGSSDGCAPHSHSSGATTCSCDGGYHANAQQTGCSSNAAPGSCKAICDSNSCGTDCPICQGTGGGKAGNSCNGCGSDVSCSGGSSSSSSSSGGANSCRWANDGACDEDGTSSTLCKTGTDTNDCHSSSSSSGSVATSSSGGSCKAICDSNSCGTDCPICQGTGGGKAGNSCNGCGSDVSCSGGSSSSSSSSGQSECPDDSGTKCGSSCGCPSGKTKQSYNSGSCFTCASSGHSSSSSSSSQCPGGCGSNAHCTGSHSCTCDIGYSVNSAGTACEFFSG